MPTAEAKPVPPHVQMMDLATGHFRTQAVIVAAKLGVADLLKDGPRTLGELSLASGAHERSLYRLLRALASLGIFAEQPDGRFALTPLAETIRTDAPNSVRPMLLLGGSTFHWSAWSELEHSIRTGGVAFERVHGRRFFDYLTDHPDAGETFDAWMTRLSQMQVPALVASYDFSAFESVVDVGGGRGALLQAIVATSPRLTGVLYEMPPVAAAARLGERCRAVGGDMFESVPGGHDLYVLKTVLHDWDDEHARRILRNCRTAMGDRGRLLLIESIVPEGNVPHPSKWMDLNMLVLNHGGMERNESEYRALLASTGLTPTRTIPTSSPMSLIEAVVDPEG